MILETSIGRVEINSSEHIDDVLTAIQSANTKSGADALDALRTSHAGQVT
jgi:hypothetical protein